MLIDSHCHLDFPDFEGETDALVARAAQAGVGRLVTISTRVRRFERLRVLLDRHEGVYGSVGTHPHQAAEEDDVTVDEIVALAAHPKVVAIGEAGLDYHYETSPRDVQARGLRRHIEAARRTGLPLVIHAREADGDMADLLEEEHARGSFSAVLHCFSSGAELARRGVRLGFYVSFSGILTFKRSDELRAIAREVPRERLLVETDAPYLAPAPHRGTRNEPSYVVETARVLADTLELDWDAIAALTTRNALALFSRMPALPAPGEARQGGGST